MQTGVVVVDSGLRIRSINATARHLLRASSRADGNTLHAEAKGLAEQTGRATGEIASQIAEIQTATDQSAEAIGGVSATIEMMNGIATAIAAAVEQQGLATDEISRNIAAASGGTASVDESARGISDAAEQTSSVAHRVGELSASLEAQKTFFNKHIAPWASHFYSDLEDFLLTISDVLL